MVACGALSLCADEPAKGPQVPGLGDPGPLQKLVIEDFGGKLILRGPDARLQLIVSGQYATGQVRDLTHTVSYEVQRPGIVSIDATGLVSPQADGEVQVTVRLPSGQTAQQTVKVENFTNQVAINFNNQVVPIFTKLGCNSGGCHGKSGGQNGFRLSLLGFYPEDDFEYLVRESRGRRLFPAAPDQSLLLLKATNLMAHGGGRRLEADSYEYRVLRRWIAQGMPASDPAAPTVTRLSMHPETRTMDRASDQQLTVWAHYTDGSIEDVTRMAQYEPNDPEMAEVSNAAVVRTLDLTGDVAVMARYAGNVTVFRASIPLGLEIKSLPQVRNFIDQEVFAKLKTLGVPPSPVCDDSTFIRRVTIDLAGRLPSAGETEAFLADQSPTKRDQLIDRLLASSDYADFFANKWASVLRNKRRQNQHMRGTFAFHDWIREQLYRNTPYDQFVAQILSASGEVSQNPSVIWYREVKTTEQQVEDTAQLFLGLRIQCARCHHHPFERWSQNDYYGFAAFFSQVGRKQGINGLQTEDEPRIYHKRGVAQARNPRTNLDLKPTGLGDQPLELRLDEDPREALVNWMSQPDNPFFAPALVNRYWRHFFGRGLVDPEDDMRVTNPACNPALLDALAKNFVDSKFDLKQLIRTICQSSTYQLSAEPNEYNLRDKQNFSRYYPQRLNAEVLYDSVLQVTGNTANFGGLPSGTRAVQLPDNGFQTYFLTVFGKPQGDTACECERSQEANLAQSLHLLNSNEIQGFLANGNGRAGQFARDKDRPHAEKVREMYLWVYSRVPTADELGVTLAHLERTENKQQAYEDILWALINSKEFLFNH